MRNRKNSSSTSSITSSLSLPSDERRESGMSISSSDESEDKEDKGISATLDSCEHALKAPSKKNHASFNDEINKAYLEIKALPSGDEKEKLLMRMLEIIRSIKTTGRQNDKLLEKLFTTLTHIKIAKYDVDEISVTTIPANLADFIAKFLKDRLTALQLGKDLQSKDSGLALQQFIKAEPASQNRTIAELKKIDPEKAKPFELFVNYLEVTVRTTDPQRKIDAIPGITAGLASLKNDGAHCFEKLYALQYTHEKNINVERISKNLETLLKNQRERHSSTTYPRP